MTALIQNLKYYKVSNWKFLLITALAVITTGCLQAQQTGSPVTIQVDLSKKSAEQLKPIWAFFGYDEPNYTYMKDGKKLLSELAQLSPVPVNVRVHNLLTTGKGTHALKWGTTNAYTEDAMEIRYTTGRSLTASSIPISSGE